MSKPYNPLKLALLNKEHTAAFRKLVEGVAYRKITSPGYMDLTIELVGKQKFGILEALDYSLCHYGEVNGDLMRDPEMCFYVFPLANDEWYVYPHYYRNDYAMGYESESIIFQEGKILVDRARQADQADFARLWMNNLREQGFVKAAATQPISRTLQQEEEDA